MKVYFAVLIAIVFMLSACSKNDSSKQANGDTVAEQAFANCMSEMSQDFKKANPAQKLPPNILEDMGAASCKIIKTQCNKDPEGAICQSLIDKYMQ